MPEKYVALEGVELLVTTAYALKGLNRFRSNKKILFQYLLIVKCYLNNLYIDRALEMCVAVRADQIQNGIGVPLYSTQNQLWNALMSNRSAF